MRRLDLDFARPPGPGRLQAAAWALAGLAALLAVALWLRQLDGQRRQWQAQLETASAAVSAPQRRALVPPREADEATRQALARANQVVASLNLGWGALFRQLEQVQQPGVTLLAVQREAGQSRRLRLSGEARRLEDALSYTTRLGATPGLAQVHLVGHDSSAEAGQARVQFTLLADWEGQP